MDHNSPGLTPLFVKGISVMQNSAWFASEGDLLERWRAS